MSSAPRIVHGRRGKWMGALLLAAIVALLAHVCIGSTEPGNPFGLRLAPAEVLRQIAFPESDSSASIIVWQLRLPRALACLLVGGILGMVGSAFQALFRNPLAEPYIIGASSGAAVGGAAALVFGFAMAAGGLGMTISAFVAGMLALWGVMALSRVRGVLDSQRMLLAGVVTSALLSAIVATVLLAAGRDSNEVLRWLLGSATPMFWNRLPMLAIAFLGGGAVLLAQSKMLNVLAVGEETAQRLGVPVERVKPTILGVGTAMTAIAVGTVGIIGFLGMVAPHIARRLVGVDWRYSLAASGFVGAILLLLSDVAAQRAVPGAELPVGVVTALLGAPALVILLRKPSASL